MYDIETHIHQAMVEMTVAAARPVAMRALAPMRISVGASEAPGLVATLKLS
jgi:hypothetical protein